MKSNMNLHITAMMCFLVVYCDAIYGSRFMQCPYDASACPDDIDCDATSMAKRAGYFCDDWPFYSGGFAECCDENYHHYTCTHSVYSPETNSVFCDFWYLTQSADTDQVQLCDCKENNDKYCTSWVCAKVSDFFKYQNSSQLLQKLLLPNAIEIFGVHECGDFTDRILLDNDHQIKQYCYKYDDFSNCFCIPSEDGEDEYCKQWVCHSYLNNAKNDLSLDEDIEGAKAGTYHNYWNISTDTANVLNISSSAIDMMKLSTKISHEEYRCTNAYSNSDQIASGLDAVDKSECVEWTGSSQIGHKQFSIFKCGTSSWNADYSTFRYNKVEEIEDHWNISADDLVESFSLKWECHEKQMNMRNNSTFLNFYLSTLIWSLCVGLILLSLIFCYMRYKYISLASFFCVQGWFLFIFGSIAAIHGGFASFVVYFVLQFIILGYICYGKWKNRGKHPYGSISQRYDFDVEESINRDDPKL